MIVFDLEVHPARLVKWRGLGFNLESPCAHNIHFQVLQWRYFVANSTQIMVQGTEHTIISLYLTESSLVMEFAKI
jgi:hypothetical protein